MMIKMVFDKNYSNYSLKMILHEMNTLQIYYKMVIIIQIIYNFILEHLKIRLCCTNLTRQSIYYYSKFFVEDYIIEMFVKSMKIDNVCAQLAKDVHSAYSQLISDIKIQCDAKSM